MTKVFWLFFLKYFLLLFPFYHYLQSNKNFQVSQNAFPFSRVRRWCFLSMSFFIHLNHIFRGSSPLVLTTE